MRISKKEYDLLTFPWRCLGEMTLRPDPPYHGFVTTCQVWQLRLLYLVAWPVAVVAALVFFVVVLPVIGAGWLIATFVEFVAPTLSDLFGSVKACKKVEWQDEPKTGEGGERG